MLLLMHHRGSMFKKDLSVACQGQIEYGTLLTFYSKIRDVYYFTDCQRSLKCNIKGLNHNPIVTLGLHQPNVDSRFALLSCSCEELWIIFASHSRLLNKWILAAKFILNYWATAVLNTYDIKQVMMCKPLLL